MTTLTMNSPGFDDRAEETRLRGYARGMMATIVEFDDLCEVTGTCSHAELQYLLGRLIRLVDDLGHVVVVGRRLAGGGRPGRPPSPPLALELREASDRLSRQIPRLLAILDRRLAAIAGRSRDPSADTPVPDPR